MNVFPEKFIVFAANLLMFLIDTHAHTYLEQFDGEHEIVTNRAVDSGVKRILLPNIDNSSIIPMTDLCNSYPHVYSIMTGMHPTSVKGNWKSELENILFSLEKNNPVAVGETGIDLYWDKTFVEEQKDAFVMQIEYAKQKDLPLVIHSRNSLDLIIDILKPYKGKIKGVFHCFPGSVQQAKKVYESGFLLGIGGVVTYKNSKMSDVAAYLPDESIILETDAPFLTPAGQRGKRNESAFISEIAEFIAQKRNTTAEHVAEFTTNNAKRLFRLTEI